MLQQGWVRVYRAFFALLTVAAMGYQFWSNSQRDPWNPVNFFSFFTIQSNLIAAIVLLLGAVTARERSSLAWGLVRGGAAMYMVTTGVVYNLLLSGLEDALHTPTPWVNMVLHQILPLMMVVDLIVRPIPAHQLTMRRALAWLIYPGLYLAYTLMRGPRVDWYPYPFLDPREPGGYGGVAVYSIVILLGFVALSSLIVVLTRHSDADETAASGKPLA